MKYLAVCLLILCAACANTPAELEGQAAAMRQNTQEAVGMMGLAAQYTQAARDADATATQAQATLMVSSARATLEMAAAQRAANAQALDNVRATATLAAQASEIAYQPTRAAATATREAQVAAQNEQLRDFSVGSLFVLILFGTLGLLMLISLLVWAAWVQIETKVHAARSDGMRRQFLETTQGLMRINPKNGQVEHVLLPSGDDEPPDTNRPSDVPAAPYVETQPAPHMDELEVFVRQCIAAVGRDAYFIPSDDVMKTSGALWSARTDRLAALGFIPRKAVGKRTMLYNGETLMHLLAHVIEYERSQRKAPSPVEGQSVTVL